jgi:energy-coupling factor transport system ATP-binding protein
VPVLHDLDLAGGSGEVVALTGDNGSGKTTLLRTISGLLPPLAGRVERRPGRIAYLPQNPSSLLHRASVRSEVEWTLRRTGSTAGAGALLDELGLGDVAGRDPRDLSSGQRQRAALAAVLAGAPSLVLLDEPTRGMDGAARRSLVAALARVAGAGGSAVVATHDQQLVAAVASRVVELRDGAARERRTMAGASR